MSVATTRARSYVDWANEYPEGVTDLDGVAVRRFSVARPRDPDGFAHLNARVLPGPHVVAPLRHREWLRFQGPELPALQPWLRANAHEFDAVICFTYLYWPTWATLDAIAGSVPTLLHPLAHDEPTLALPLFGEELFHRPDALLFLTEEEQQALEEESQDACSKPNPPIICLPDPNEGIFYDPCPDCGVWVKLQLPAPACIPVSLQL